MFIDDIVWEVDVEWFRILITVADPEGFPLKLPFYLSEIHFQLHAEFVARHPSRARGLNEPHPPCGQIR